MSYAISVGMYNSDSCSI